MLRLFKRRSNGTKRGDTLIEVLFAITVLSAAIVGALAIMNKGTQASIQSLETTLVRQQIDAQIDTLRFLSSSYVAAYHAGYAPTTTNTPAEVYYDVIKNVGSSTPTKFGAGGLTDCPAIPTSAFVLNTKTAKKVGYAGGTFGPAETFARVNYTDAGAFDKSLGIWIEGIRSTTESGAGYTDFHVNACWSSPGMDTPRSIGTIVRLYEPRT